MSQFINFIVELYDELLNETKHDYSEDIIKGFLMTHSEVEAVAEFYRNAARNENSKKAKEKSLSWYEKIGLGCEEENCRIRISRMADALYRMYLTVPCHFTVIDNSKFHKVIITVIDNSKFHKVIITVIDNSKFHKVIMRRIGEKLSYKELESIFMDLKDNNNKDEVSKNFEKELWYLIEHFWYDYL